MINRADFIVAVRSCIGTPVVHAGRVIGECLDCAGVIWSSLVACGADPAPIGPYASWPSESELSEFMSGYADRVPSLADEPHVLQVFAGKQGRHLVVPIGVNDAGQIVIVHAWKGNRLVVESVLGDRIFACWRLRGVS